MDGIMRVECFTSNRKPYLCWYSLSDSGTSPIKGPAKAGRFQYRAFGALWWRTAGLNGESLKKSFKAGIPLFPALEPYCPERKSRTWLSFLYVWKVNTLSENLYRFMDADGPDLKLILNVFSGSAYLPSCTAEQS